MSLWCQGWTGGAVSGFVDRVRRSRRAVRMGGVPHSKGELAQLVRPLREAVGLQVEQELEAVLHLAQEPVGVVEPAGFGVRQAAGRLEGFDGPQGVAPANGRQVAAV